MNTSLIFPFPNTFYVLSPDGGPVEVVVDGSGSYDLDGDALQFQFGRQVDNDNGKSWEGAYVTGPVKLLLAPDEDEDLFRFGASDATSVVFQEFVILVLPPDVMVATSATSFSIRDKVQT